MRKYITYGLFLVAGSQSLTAGVTYRVYATREGLVGQTTANGHVITSTDRFVALPSGTVLNSNNGYTYTVTIVNPANGRVASNVPVWDKGPWNLTDNYWHNPRVSKFASIAVGTPAASVQYSNHTTAEDGKVPSNPAGIDLAEGTWADLAMSNNGYVDVTYNWEAGPLPSMSPKPAVGVNLDGHLEVFAIPADGSMWQDWQTAPNGPWYAGGSGALGGNLNTAVATARNQDGRMSTFVLGSGTGVFFKRQTSPGSGWDSGWSSLGGNGNTALTVVPNADGRLDAFVLGGGTAVFHQWQTAPNSSTWSGSWTSLGGNGNTALTVKANLDGRLEAFVLGGGSAVFHRWQTAANSTNWNTTGWESLGGNSNTALDVVMDSGSCLHAFVMGGGTAIFHRWQTTPGGSWNSTSWESLGGNGNTAMSVIQNTDGRLEVFVLGNGSAVFHRWQTGLGGGGTWNSTGWESLGGNNNTALTTGRDANGRLEVFVVGSGSGTRKLYRKAQTSAGSSTWESAWQELGGNLK